MYPYPSCGPRQRPSLALEAERPPHRWLPGTAGGDTPHNRTAGDRLDASLDRSGRVPRRKPQRRPLLVGTSGMTTTMGGGAGKT